MGLSEENAAKEYKEWLSHYQAEKLRNPLPAPEPPEAPPEPKLWVSLPFMARDPVTKEPRLFTWSEFDALSKSDQIAALCTEP